MTKNTGTIISISVTGDAVILTLGIVLGPLLRSWHTIQQNRAAVIILLGVFLVLLGARMAVCISVIRDARRGGERAAQLEAEEAAGSGGADNTGLP